ALAVEIALQPMTDRLVEQDARPAGSEDDVESAGRGWDRAEVDQRLAERLIHAVVPRVGGDELAEAFAAAGAVGAALLAVAVADDDGDVDPHQRPDVADERAVGADDLDLLVAAGERRRDLADARVLLARVGIDRFEELHLLGKSRRKKRALVAVE